MQPMKSLSLSGKAALVTGSSQGIGLAMALGLSEAGARVVFHGLQENAPAGVPPAAAYVAADLLEDDGPEQLVKAAFQHEPDLDILICNAGSFFDSAPLALTRELWDRTFRLNVSASFFVVQAFVKRLVEHKRPGSIVIVSSTNGFQAEANSVAYDASKGALVMMTRSLAVSLAAHGIRVNGVAPGLIRTPLTSVWMESRAHDLLPHYERSIPLGRIGKPGDLAGAAVFLSSPAASYITGEIIVVDGGLTISQVGRMSE